MHSTLCNAHGAMTRAWHLSMCVALRTVDRGECAKQGTQLPGTTVPAICMMHGSSRCWQRDVASMAPGGGELHSGRSIHDVGGDAESGGRGVKRRAALRHALRFVLRGFVWTALDRASYVGHARQV